MRRRGHAGNAQGKRTAHHLGHPHHGGHTPKGAFHHSGNHHGSTHGHHHGKRK